MLTDEPVEGGLDHESCFRGEACCCKHTFRGLDGGRHDAGLEMQAVGEGV
jgi:hypothetical protein